MKNLIEELTGSLEEELRIHEALHEIGLRKREELVRLDVAAVEKSTREEQAVLAALGETGSRRLRATQDLARALQVPDPQATVRNLSARLPMPDRSKLFDLACALERAMTKVARVSASNRLLTEQSLKYIQDFFSILTDSATDAGTYARTGRPRPPPGRLMIDQVI